MPGIADAVSDGARRILEMQPQVGPHANGLRTDFGNRGIGMNVPASRIACTLT